MEPFEYEPIDLEGPAFRVLRLLKGREVDIECELFQGWLHGDSNISYEALSYTWGGTERAASIKINGRTLNVTENLYLALQHLRSPDIDRTVWADAICIDQDNTKERGHQVQQMGDIYSQAERVIVWLGSATDETDVLMDSLKQLERESIKYACKDWKRADDRWKDLWSSIQPTLKSRHFDLASRQRAGLEILLCRPWFKRVWILQEVANAKRALVCCGTQSVSARIFALAPLLVLTEPDVHCQAVLDIMPGPSREDSWWSEKRDLHTLLMKFKESEASDSRDKIYALLGLSSDAKDTDSLRVDYTKTPQEVVYDATSFLFDLPGVHITMEAFLGNFTQLNTTALGPVIRSNNASAVAKFLKHRGDHVEITEEILEAAAENTAIGKEAMALLLEQKGAEVKIKQTVLTIAAGNTGSGKEVIALLLEKRGREFEITAPVVEAAVGNRKSGKEIIELLLQHRGEEVVTTAARSGKNLMALLLAQTGGQVKITEAVVRAAGQSVDQGREVMALLVTERVEAFEITDRLTVELARMCSASHFAVLLEQRGDEVKITEAVVKAAAENKYDGYKVMALLLKKRGDEVKITQEVFTAALMNREQGEEMIKLILTQRGGEVGITEEVVKAAAQNWRRRRVMGLVRKRQESITEGVKGDMELDD